jgi:aspartate carbamoyltransferase catalytic subunit
LVDARDFEGQDILSLYDWSREKIEYTFKVAEKMEPIVLSRTRSQLLADKVLAACFYTPSTRTRTSFQSAMTRLGGSVIGWEAGASSRARDVARLATGEGESDKDTAIMLSHYADVIAVRHDRTGGPREMARWATIPVINCADGPNEALSEHPTQALLDLYTIKKEFGRIDGLKILSLGSQASIRGGHSISFGYAKFKNVKEYICAEKPLQPEHEKRLEELGGGSGKYQLTASKLKGCKDSLIIMHQLPRGEGISTDVDETKYARYLWQEAWNGVPMRMGLLSLVLGRAPPV